MRNRFGAGLAVVTTAAVTLLAGSPVSAQHTFDGNIIWGNAAVSTQASGAACAAALVGMSNNDTATNPLLGAPQYPGTNWRPGAGSIASGQWDNVSTIGYAVADTCDDCGCGRVFQQVCYRGAFKPVDDGPDTWATGWTCYSGDCLPALGTIVAKSGVQATQTWTAGNTYVLQGKVSFPSGTTLTINPGVLVLGENATGGYLVIERGAKIFANGTAASPIVFTSDQAAPAPGGWGGIVVHGRAVANCADCLGGASCVSEGGAGSHCGTNDCDDSGRIRYTRVQFSGIEIAPANELNCFTFNSVGCAAGVSFASFCEAYRGSDDSFEWFGGKGNYDHLVAIGGWDDGLDWQMGFRGTVQFAVVQHWQDGGDKGIEADNNEFAFNAPCRSNPLFANLTLIGTEGLVPEGTPHSGIHLRRGTDAHIFNSISAFWPVSGLRVEHVETCARGTNPQPASPLCRTSVPEGLTSTERFAFRAYPNPVVSEARFSFRLDEPSRASLGIYDVSGRLVSMAINRDLVAGQHEVDWTPAATLASGHYFYRFEGGGAPVMGSFTIVR